MRERGGQKLLARLISDEHVVLLRRPVNTSISSHLKYLLAQNTSTAPRPRGTVADAHRQALNRGYVLLPLRGTSPPPGAAGLLPALARASHDGPLPAAVEAHNQPRMPYEPRRADSACGRMKVLLPCLCRSLGEVDEPARECRCFVNAALLRKGGGRVRVTRILRAGVGVACLHAAGMSTVQLAR
jgi:hypothetical protein